MGAPASSVSPLPVASVSITPPPRPTGLGAPLAPQPVQQVAIANVPLPPVRSSALVTVASAEKPPAPTLAPLPDLIRQGPEPIPAVAVMAYASQPAEAIALRGSVAPPLSPLAMQRALAPRRTQFYAARLDQTNFAMLTQSTTLAATMPQKDLGIRPGLRAAVKAEGRAVVLQGSPLLNAQTSAMMVELRADRFSGATLRPVRTAALAMDAASDLR
jgi:hypothetical protein